MKKKYPFPSIIVILLLQISFSGAQNLVSNCSFEQHDTCPDNAGQMQRATGWFNTYGNADYYNSCSSSDWTVPPHINYQLAATGNAFAGATLFSEQVGSIEMIHTILSAPLSIGTTYYVSFKVNLCLNASEFTNQAIDKIGAKFTTGGHAPLINNSAQVYTNTIVVDTANWTTISGSFVADSAYTRLYLGVFFDTAHVASVMVVPSLIDRAYYFIDDVCVSPNPADVCALVGIAEASAQNAFMLYPNPVAGELRIQNSELKIKNVEIVDVLGQRIYNSAFNIQHSELTINVSSLSPGIYFVVITDEKNNRALKKLIKL